MGTSFAKFNDENVEESDSMKLETQNSRPGRLSDASEIVDIKPTPHKPISISVVKNRINTERQSSQPLFTELTPETARQQPKST